MAQKRKYSMGRRRERINQTRARIIKATMELHEEIGGARTTISAIAERAGVERLTVYRHFPDEAALFQACTAHWLTLNPPPNAEDWSEIVDPRERTKAALESFASYYRATEPMWVSSYRDLDDVPALAEPMARFHQYLAAIRDDLLAAWNPGKSSRRMLTALLDHALHFQTWQSFARNRLKDKEIAELLTACVASAVHSKRS
ncbi:MAG: TetR family transcriptional regulator [candidate division Zixibacteria bacterium]|nr:TetR family transcriptional regulator [candidate division Zixibacteria bacterium]